MWLDDIGLDERLAVPACGADDASVLWLTAGDQAARVFAGMTASMPNRVTPDENPSVWLDRGSAMLEQADPLLVRSLRSAASRACPVIVVRGLPVEPIPPATPYDGVVDLASSHRAIVNLHAVLACLGLHPVAYAGENASTLHAVSPVRGARGEVSSHGFDAALPFHTDYADRPIDERVTDQSPSAHALVFGIERAEPAVPMQCIPTRRLLSMLSSEQIRIGRAEEFMVHAPDLFGGGHPARIRCLFLSDGGVDGGCRLNLGKMMGLTRRASRLLCEIRDILSDESLVEQIHVRRGDVVVMDNRRAIHRRASFVPRWDGTDRYFIRMSAARDPYAGVSADSHRPWVWS
jgi:hypothetical protein